MLLNIEERIILLELFYEIDRYIPLPIVRKLYEKLYLSEDEISENGFYIENGKYGWTNDNGWEIDFPPGVEHMICESLEEMSRNGELNTGSFKLYELFCGDK